MIRKGPKLPAYAEACFFFVLAGWIGLTFLVLLFGRHVFPGYQLWRSFHLAGLYIPFSFFFLGRYLVRKGYSAVLPVRLCLGIVPFLFASVTLKILFGQASPLIDVINAAMSPLFSVPLFGLVAIFSAMIVVNDRITEGVLAGLAKIFAGLWDDGAGPRLEDGRFGPREGAYGQEEQGAEVVEFPPWLAVPEQSDPGTPSAATEGQVARSPLPENSSWVDPDPGLEIMGSAEDEAEHLPWQPGDPGQRRDEGPTHVSGAEPAGPQSFAPAVEEVVFDTPQEAMVLQEDGAKGRAEPRSGEECMAAGPEGAVQVAERQPESRQWGASNDRLLAPLWGKALAYPRSKRRWVQYRVPIERLLDPPPSDSGEPVAADVHSVGEVLLQTLMEFKIEAQVTGVSCGPSITQYEILPAPGVKLSRIESLSDNISLRLAAPSVRIVAPIPGKRAVGIELPNTHRRVVSFRDVMADESAVVASEDMALPVVLGRGIDGQVHMLDLSQAPHLLVAGATGSGKSVCINILISSLIARRAPTQMRLLMVDPKIVELKLYNDIPHLLTPVITDPKQALQALRWCLGEMERRYWLLDHVGVRDIGGYNRRLKERGLALPPMEYMVIIVDEFADLMALTGKEMEALVARMAAMSRAVGMHMVLATQRPSVDVITGLIKANFPTRIAFMVASKVDARIILDAQGAEQLLGKGDMLFSSPMRPSAERIQGAFLSEDEVERITDYVRSQGEPHYVDEILMSDEEGEDANVAGDGEDPLYEKALQVAQMHRQVSASMLQRRLQIGYNRAARMVERMEADGLVGPQNGSKPRELLSP